MTLAIAVAVFLLLPAVAAAARIAAHYRHGSRGRPDLEWGNTRDITPAEARSRSRHPSRLAAGDASSSRARTKTRRPTLRPAFHIGATPVPERVSPRPSDRHIRREFDLDSLDHRGRAA